MREIIINNEINANPKKRKWIIKNSALRCVQVCECMQSRRLYVLSITNMWDKAVRKYTDEHIHILNVESNHRDYINASPYPLYG